MNGYQIRCVIIFKGIKEETTVLGDDVQKWYYTWIEDRIQSGTCPREVFLNGLILKYSNSVLNLIGLQAYAIFYVLVSPGPFFFS